MGFANVASPSQIFLYPLLLLVDEITWKKYSRVANASKMRGGITESRNISGSMNFQHYFLLSPIPLLPSLPSLFFRWTRSFSSAVEFRGFCEIFVRAESMWHQTINPTSIRMTRFSSDYGNITIRISSNECSLTCSHFYDKNLLILLSNLLQILNFTCFLTTSRTVSL